MRRALAKNVVEVRIHSDHATKAEENRALQRAYMKIVANPYYIIIDPTTKKEVRRYDPNEMNADNIVRFLNGEP